jgi:hypothetical protein
MSRSTIKSTSALLFGRTVSLLNNKVLNISPIWDYNNPRWGFLLLSGVSIYNLKRYRYQYALYLRQ